MFAVAGGKGGTGTTTTALGLASALPGPTTVVDADVDMPDLHLLAGVDREPTLAAVDGDRRPSTLPQSRPGASGVSVLPAPTPGGEVDITAALARLSGSWPGRVLVDCPAGAGPDAVTPVRAADGVVVVATADPSALCDATKTAATARAVGTPVVGLVLTRTHAEPPAASRLLDCPLLGAVPDVEPPVLARERVRSAYRAVAGSLLGSTQRQEI